VWEFSEDGKDVGERGREEKNLSFPSPRFVS